MNKHLISSLLFVIQLASTIAAAPTVVTLPATSVNNSVATLIGTVDPGGLDTSAWFEWRFYPFNSINATAPVLVGSGANVTALSNLLSGLTPGIFYRCRAVASNSLGIVRGDEVTFGSPILALNGPAILTNECPAFTDPVTATGGLLAIAAGEEHNLAIKSDGRVAAWGYSYGGQTSIPVGLSNVVAISAGANHSLALKRDGTVAQWGGNCYCTSYNPLTNIPVGLSNVVAISAGSGYNLVLRSDGTLTAWGNNYFGQTNIPVGLSNVVAISAGYGHNLVLRSDGTLVAWGYNEYGQTNIPIGLSNVAAIAAGFYHSLALRGDGTVAAWGDNRYGQTSIPIGLSNVVAISATEFLNLALKSDGTVAAWGAGWGAYNSSTVRPSNVVAIAAGRFHGLALRSDGTLVAWGLNDYGQTNVPVGLTAIPVTVSGSVNTNIPGSYILNYTATNNSGGIAGPISRTVVVRDTKPPVITVLGSNPFTNFMNIPFNDPGASALDACGGSFPVSTNGAVNVAVPGAYPVTYTSTDNYSNTTNAVRTVIVVGPPTFGSLTAVVVGTNGANGALTVQFTAAVNPNGGPSSVNFQYGLSPYAGTNGPVNLPASFTASNVTVTVGGFSAGLSYHWNATAKNSAGSASAPDQTFSLATAGLPGDINADGLVSQSELAAVYGIYLSNSPGPYMMNVAGLGGSHVTFSLSNSLLSPYSVLYSTNLSNWYPLGPTSLRYSFDDTNAPAQPRRYYRLSYP